MTIVDRVKATVLPLDQLVVIGSGVLDALELRRSGDIDLAVSNELFEMLKLSGQYTCVEKYSDEVLLKDDLEIWKNWGLSDDLSFASLYKDGITISGVRFCNPVTVIAQKRARGLPKDLRDIELLEEYIRTPEAKFQ